MNQQSSPKPTAIKLVEAAEGGLPHHWILQCPLIYGAEKKIQTTKERKTGLNPDLYLCIQGCYFYEKKTYLRRGILSNFITYMSSI